MSGLGSKVSARPKVVIAIILVLTIVLGYFGSGFENEADPESFNPDHELIIAANEAEEDEVKEEVTEEEDKIGTAEIVKKDE